MSDNSHGGVWNESASVANLDLRRKVVELVYQGKDGHIPSALSIIDILHVLYRHVLRHDPQAPKSPTRDYFILSKGHGCVGLYVVLRKFGYVSDDDLKKFCRAGGILGEHPDANHIPGVEASTGSLGHGMPFATGIALALRIRKLDNRVITLVGDGECQEGTIWEAANIAANQRLGNLTVVVDWNLSGAQLMPLDNLPAKWSAFGFRSKVVDGHDEGELKEAFEWSAETRGEQPSVIVARTIKGKGVPFLQGHGPWHHKIPSAEEFERIMEALR